MNCRIFSLFVLLMSLVSDAAEVPGRKIYECRYMAEPPRGVYAWSRSEAVAKGTGRESRFVPYNSESAQNLWLDAAAVRDVSNNPALKNRNTSFYMVYDERGWHIYIRCDEPDVRKYLDEKKQVSLELFFAPGMENVHYYQMMISQPSGKTDFFDWGMPHRDYRSLKDFAEIDSRALPGGFGTYVFIPWEALYDRLPLNNDCWRFTLIRWGPAVTWGGKVHDTGNFGLIRFEKPSPAVAEKIRKDMLRTAWFKFKREARKAASLWNDPEMGDPDFFRKNLKPLIDRYEAAGAEMGNPDAWTSGTVERFWPNLKDWMEFKYTVSALRTEYLKSKMFAESR